tara:strand:+ start:242 stop:2728 length:2487 start_codon:yes stop_codon:yes gene_type:complete
MLFMFVADTTQAQGFAVEHLQNPSEFLGYELGTNWTPHHKVMDYVQHLAEHSEMVTAFNYGITYEGRELVYLVISSEENQQNMGEIRQNNLRRIGLQSGEVSEAALPIVWLSYNVHGNETSSSEAALYTMHALVTEYQNWLNDVVVVIDPMVNPDGRERYVNWNKMVTGVQFNPNHEAMEHHEPWPGGRTNHYFFDLNRDWAWQTQTETQQRIRQYLEWMPMVHVDFHEQNYNTPYYFAPAAEPYHNAITDWQRELQTLIGQNHASYFDQNNWLYFTREVFDLFYPSYGDTWPTFNGAIGMTYEQAGHSFAGLGVLTDEGDTLTLYDRMIHHAISGLSTIETVVNQKERVLSEFQKYFDTIRKNGSGNYKTFVIKRGSNPDNTSRLLRYLLDQKIQVQQAVNEVRANGYDYQNGKVGRVTIQKGDFIVNTYQSQGTLVRVLFEPKPEYTDSLTYDITAWEAHYSFGVEGYAIQGQVEVQQISFDIESELTPVVNNPYAYLVEWNSFDDAQFLAYILKQGVRARYSENSFSIQGKNYNAGTLIITRNGNESLGTDFDDIVKEGALVYNRELTPVTTGLVTQGKDFGSSSVRSINAPRVGLLAGAGTSGNMVGHIWYFFDQQLNYPITMIPIDIATSMDWTQFDVIILPSGSYGYSFNDSQLSEIRNWVRGGGKLVAVDGANGFLVGKDGFALTRKSRSNDDADNLEDRLQRYADAERNSVANFNAGAIYTLNMDPTHPLAFGYKEHYMSLKLGSTAYEYLENGWNVGVVKDGAPRSGFVGYKAQKVIEESLSYGVQSMGQGQVIYMIDNPFFRGFWHNGKLLISNAVFF